MARDDQRHHSRSRAPVLNAVSAGDSPIGRRGRVTGTGAIRPGRIGEVMVSIRGGVEAFMAKAMDDTAIEPYEEIVVVEYDAPRTVLVSRLYDKPDEETAP